MSLDNSLLYTFLDSNSWSETVYNSFSNNIKKSPGGDGIDLRLENWTRAKSHDAHLVLPRVFVYKQLPNAVISQLVRYKIQGAWNAKIIKFIMRTENQLFFFFFFFFFFFLLFASIKIVQRTPDKDRLEYTTLRLWLFDESSGFSAAAVQ